MAIKRKVFLHIGLGKTGSSALQSWLSMNVAEFAAQDIEYVDLTPDAKFGKITSGNGVRLRNILRDNDYKTAERLIREKYLGFTDKSIISSEGFQGVTEAELQDLEQIFNTNNVDVEIIAFTRSVYEQTYSAYLQNVKRHGQCEEFKNSHVMKKGLKYAHPNMILKKYFNVFSNRVSVFNYDEAKVDIFSSFAEIVGVDVTKTVIPAKRINRSLSFLEAKVLVQMNRLHTGDFSTEISDYLIYKLPALKTQVYFSKTLITRMENEVIPNLDWVNKTFFKGKQPIKKHLFTPEQMLDSTVSSENDSREESDILNLIGEWALAYTIKKKKNQFNSFLTNLIGYLQGFDGKDASPSDSLIKALQSRFDENNKDLSNSVSLKTLKPQLNEAKGLRKLILHVGFHKTATSSIQQTLANNHDILANAGWFFPLFKFNAQQSLANHSVPLFTLFTEHPEKYQGVIRLGVQDKVAETKNAWFTQLESMIANHNQVILSGEAVSMLSTSSLQKLKEYFIALGFKISVICSVRRPYSFLCSSIQQNIKGGIRGFKEGLFTSRIKEIENLKLIFDDVIFYNFEASCQSEGGPVLDFIRKVGVPTSEIKVTSTNEGIGNKTTRLYLAINERYPIIDKGKLNPKGRVKKVINFDNDKFLLTEPELQKVLPQLKVENKRMQNLLGDEFCDKSFPTSINIFLSKKEALDMYVKAAKPGHVSRMVLDFILEHADFALEELCDSDCVNPELLRDVALHLEPIDITAALSYMKRAQLYRPNGSVINKKIKQYRQELALT